MGKPKAKHAAAVVARKKDRGKESVTKNNPFEVRVNRKKHDVLGQSIKSGRGLPGVSRSKAIQKVRGKRETQTDREGTQTDRESKRKELVKYQVLIYVYFSFPHLFFSSSYSSLFFFFPPSIPPLLEEEDSITGISSTPQSWKVLGPAVWRAPWQPLG